MNSTSSTSKGRDPIDLLQERVAQLHGQMRRATTVTAIGGIVAAVLLTVYFNYAYNQIVDLTKPESIVMHMDQLLVDNLTGTREALQKQIEGSAPEWAHQLSLQAIHSVPELRNGVENFVLTHVEQQLEDADLIGNEEFKKLLDRHKDAFRAQAKLLADNGKLPEESMHDFVANYDQHFQVSFKETTDTLFENLFNMNKNLTRLKANQGLTEEERQQRRLIMLAKAIQGKRPAGDKQAMNSPVPAE